MHWICRIYCAGSFLHGDIYICSCVLGLKNYTILTAPNNPCEQIPANARNPQSSEIYLFIHKLKTYRGGASVPSISRCASAMSSALAIDYFHRGMQLRG
jgi:hypothetical protein